MKNICVYCSSSSAVAPVFTELARHLGEMIGKRGHALIYGGANIGLMGEVSRAVTAAGGKVTGVIPEIFHERNLSYEEADSLIITADLRERKARMAELADAFIAMPGGFGTLEEIMEVLTLKQIGLLNVPVVFINTNNFYSHLFSLFNSMAEGCFMKKEYLDLYHAASDAVEALDYIETFVPGKLPSKWF
ncbi:MAG: TIGR00730 family Rossman fold protein [Spirochaetae bacterium HGW-Spirochaetae-1]|nr:MAG: TIGR00730 family Rossman fold protein [Spirochaetae bacterium HGW-Spirochaetae-1]